MATIKIILKDKPLANGLFPVYLRMTKDRKRKLISTTLSCEKSQWNPLKEEFRKNYESHVQCNASLASLKRRAEKVFTDSLAEGVDITLDEFEEIFFNFKKDKMVELKEFWQEKIESLIEAKNVGNARAYKDAKNSFFKFAGESKKLFFKDVTPDFLNKYETFLRANNGTNGGISVKMRTIRALYNDAIESKIATQENYPFTVYKISKLKSTNNKRALEVSDVEKIRSLDLNKYPELLDSRNYFIFSYFTRGMNFYDMMMLEWKNIETEKIIYTRRKTKGKFNIKILPPVREILNYYKDIPRKATKYVFPILITDVMTPTQIEYRKDKVLKKFNRDLKKIADVCKIDAIVTSYVARHSFATNLKQKGVSTDIISEAMGHKNVSITQSYLKDLEASVIEDAVDKLL